MITERTYTTSALPVTLQSVKDHLRVTHDYEDASISLMALAAIRDIEAHAGIALTSQTISVTTDDDLPTRIELGIGPSASAPAVTVAVIEDDGTTTAIATGWTFRGGRYPALQITDTTITGPLRITYAAGYASLPDGMALAIADQALRTFGQRGDEDVKPGLSAAAARIVARNRQVRL